MGLTNPYAIVSVNISNSIISKASEDIVCICILKYVKHL